MLCPLRAALFSGYIFSLFKELFILSADFTKLFSLFLSNLAFSHSLLNSNAAKISAIENKEYETTYDTHITETKETFNNLKNDIIDEQNFNSSLDDLLKI